MYKKVMLILILSAFLLTACSTVEHHDIYTVAKIDDSHIYVYDDRGVFYVINQGIATLHSGAGITKSPALSFVEKSGNYSFTPMNIPHCYTATLRDVESYVAYLDEEDCATYSLTYCDYKMIDVNVVAKDYSTRIIWDLSGTARIYSVDTSGSPITTPYINEDD